MKRITFLVAIALACSPAAAADFSIGGTYGNPAGCATAGNAGDVPTGKAQAVTAKTMWDGDAICTVLDASAATHTDDGTAWDVKVSCQAGDDVAERGTVKIVEAADHSFLTAAAPDKVGPKGRLKLCRPSS